MESLYSSNSTKLSANYYRCTTKPTRKPTNITMAPVISEIRQRVKSARLLRAKHLQNELNDAQLHVTVIIITIYILLFLISIYILKYCI